MRVVLWGVFVMLGWLWMVLWGCVWFCGSTKNNVASSKRGHEFLDHPQPSQHHTPPTKPPIAIPKPHTIQQQNNYIPSHHLFVFILDKSLFSLFNFKISFQPFFFISIYYFIIIIHFFLSFFSLCSFSFYLLILILFFFLSIFNY